MRTSRSPPTSHFSHPQYANSQAHTFEALPMSTPRALLRIRHRERIALFANIPPLVPVTCLFIFNLLLAGTGPDVEALSSSLSARMLCLNGSYIRLIHLTHTCCIFPSNRRGSSKGHRPRYTRSCDCFAHICNDAALTGVTTRGDSSAKSFTLYKNISSLSSL